MKLNGRKVALKKRGLTAHREELSEFRNKLTAKYRAVLKRKGLKVKQARRKIKKLPKLPLKQGINPIFLMNRQGHRVMQQIAKDTYVSSSGTGA